jgi:hypothetical protein
MKQSLFLTCLAALCAAPLAIGQNLLTDGDFEFDFAEVYLEFDSPTYWTGFSNAFIVNDLGDGSGGFQSLKLFGFRSGRDTTVGGIAFNNYETNDIPVTPGTTYRFRTLLRSGDDIAAEALEPGTYIISKIEWLDAAGVIMAAYEDRHTMIIDWTDAAGVWEDREIIDIAPAGAVSARTQFLFFYNVTLDLDGRINTSTGAAFADDVIFEVSSEVTPELKASNLLVNGGFEDTTSVSQFDGWTVFGNAGPYSNIIDPDGDGDINDDDGTDFGVNVIRGNTSLVMNQTFEGADNDSGAYQDVPVTAGSSYVFSAVGRNGAGVGDETAANVWDRMTAGNRALIKIEWRDDTDAILGEVEDMVNGEVDTVVGEIPASPATQEEIPYLSVSGVAPAGATKARVFLLHSYTGTGTTEDSGGSSWFDDVCFEQLSTPSVPLVITDISKVGSTATITFDSESGATYSLLRSTAPDALTPGDFTPVVGQDTIPGTGSSAMATDSAATESEVFYTIQQNP